MNDVLAALGNFDTQLYLAIAAQRNLVTSVIAVALTYLNWSGFFWWILAFLLLRSRGVNRRGLAATGTVVLGMLDAWVFTEILKVIVRRPRPFEALAAVPGPLPAPETVIAHPSSFSFPSGDASLAMGAAVAFAFVSSRYRAPVLLFGVAAALARVVVGVHYPFDVVGGMVVGIVSGLAAPQAVRLIRRRLRWRAFVVPHTHWDREWEERFEAYRARLVQMVSRLLALLERDPAFRSFTFDGQTIAIQDYLEKRPEDRERVAALVKAERLFIGPWHVLADLLLVSGESIVRNLQEGLRSAGELGRAARVAYVADPFGHPAQLPQILRAFGYDTYVFARGMGDEGEAVGSEFQWEAPSGDRVRAAHLVDHYANALSLVGPGDEAPLTLRSRVAKRVARIVDRLTAYANGDALLLMVGDDHVEPYARLPEAVQAMRRAFPNIDARIASLEEYSTAMPPLEHLVSGEIVRGRYRPILRGVNSTRTWIKQENVACERLLVEICEPLDALTGGRFRDDLRTLWRTLLQNHPHDSICGCSIDAVHDMDMAPRFAFVRERGAALAKGLLRELAGWGDAPMIWDPLPWARDAVVEVDGRPARVRTAGLGLLPLARSERSAVGADDTAIENGHLRVEVGTDGTFVIVDKASGERSGRQNALISEGDRGDEYTYSYAGPTVGSVGIAGTRSVRVAGDRAIATVDLVLRLPVGLRDDRLARSPDLVDCPVRVEVSLDAGARRVDVSLAVDNRARDHRLRAVCETGTRSVTHFAGAAFALLERANRFPVRRRWVEPATAEACLHDIVLVKGASRGLAVGVDGLREYSVLHDGGTIAITLLRAVGSLSRGDLPERRGHAGKPLETPSAQCIGERRYRYTLVPLDDQTDVAGAVRTVREWLSPPLVVKGGGTEKTFLSFEDPATPIVLCALRAGPDGALVIRLANPHHEEAAAAVRFARPIRSSKPVDLREGAVALGNTGLDVVRTAAPLDADGSVATARLQPYEIGTWVVQLG
ncbi:MAG TPA: phosphatase PAP2 family protein [Candidatus Limnocylindria bacterium]|nr:phosphatase PAP2 family protein [Candidatus Limnocylindria bacterium]